MAGLAQTYLVGGTVRDHLMNRPAADHDIATGQDPAGLADEVARRTGGHVILFKKPGFAVYRVLSPRDGVFDISAIFGPSIEADLGNRDFTINAMAMEPCSGRIIDPLYGQTDLFRRRIRVASPRAFENDPARLLRAFRLSAEFDFRLSATTWVSATACASRIADIPGERIRQEFLKLVHTPRSAMRLKWMAQIGLLNHLIPQWPSLSRMPIAPGIGQTGENLALNTVAALESSISGRLSFSRSGAQYPPHCTGLIKMAALLADIGRPVVRRLTPKGGWIHPSLVPRTVAEANALLCRMRFSRRERNTVALFLQTLHWPMTIYIAACAGRPTDLPATRFFMAAENLVPAVLQLSLARRESLSTGSPDPAGASDFSAFLQTLETAYEMGYRIRRNLPPLLNGHNVVAILGRPPGPYVKRILAIIRLYQLAGAITSPASAKVIAEKFFSTRV